jgi:hypothetical protein
MGDVDAGATESTIEAAENRLHQCFPDDYRTFLRSENGLEKWFGDVYLSLYTIEQVVELNEAHEHLAYQPELIHIGSEGGGEAIGFDSDRTHLPWSWSTLCQPTGARPSCRRSPSPNSWISVGVERNCAGDVVMPRPRLDKLHEELFAPGLIRAIDPIRLNRIGSAFAL